MQPKSQFSSGYSSHKASAPKSPVAQFEELDCSTHATQPRNYSTQTLNSGYATKKLIWFMQNSAKCTSRGKSGEIKNEYSLRKRLHMSWVPSSTKKDDNKQAKIYAGNQASEEGAEGEEGEWTSTGASGSPE